MAIRPPEGGVWVPLKLSNEPCALADEFTRNIEATLKRGYTRFNEYIESQTGSLSICGFAPSLKESYRQLVGHVMACNRAHDWLISQGIVPKWCLLMDPLEVIADMVSPHPDVTYLVASRCHPAVFEKLEGYDVVVWHCCGDAVLMPLLEKHFSAPTIEEATAKQEPTVNGGTATVTRGAVVGITMGYTDIHVFGADSSFPHKDGDTHLAKSLVDEKVIHVMCDGRDFWSTPWMTLQVEDVRVIFNDLRDKGITFTFYGEGLLQHAAKAHGYRVLATTDSSSQPETKGTQ